MVNDLFPAEGGVAIVDGEVVVMMAAVVFTTVLVLTGAGGVTSLHGVSVVVVTVVVSGTPSVYGTEYTQQSYSQHKHT